MIMVLCLFYSAFYLLFFDKLKWFKKSVRNISIFIGIGVVIIGAIVIMWRTYAPISPDARMMQYVIPIVPNVNGRVIEVNAKPLVAMKEGDVLYKIDPTPYQFTVDQLNASIVQAQANKSLAETEVKRTSGLVRANAGSQADLDRWRANLESADAAITSLQAQLGNAQWQLDETVVRAPHDGQVINLQLRPGNMVTSIPLAASMTFVSDEIKDIVASFSQSSIRRIQIGDPVEIVFSLRPGQIYTGKVTHIIEASGEAQLTASGTLPTVTGQPVTSRWPIRVSLDDPEVAAGLPQSAAGTLSVYTEGGGPVWIISKVTLRAQAWVAYLTSP